MDLATQGRLGDYPIRGCCAVYTLSSFPYDTALKASPAKEVKAYLEELDKVLKEHIEYTRTAHKSIIVATINTDQLRMEKILLDNGFKSQEEWAYRDPSTSGSTKYLGVGVKVYVKYVFDGVTVKPE